MASSIDEHERRRRSTDALWQPVLKKYEAKEGLIPAEILRRVERDIMLQIVDAQWKDHLYSLDHLKEGIGLRGYGQRDPLVEYKKESFALFQAMKDRIDEEMVRYLWRLPPVDGRRPERPPPVRQPAAAPAAADDAAAPQQAPAPSPFGAFGGAGGRRVCQRRRRTAEAGPDRRRRRDQAGQPRRAEGRPQRSLSVRQREEVQEVPWGVTGCQVPRVPRVPKGGNKLKAAYFAAFVF